MLGTRLILVFTLLAVAPVGWAQPERTTDEELQRLYRAAWQQPDEPPLALSLRDCVHLAVQANQDILVVSYEPLKTDGDIMAAWGEFDPSWSATATYLESIQTSASDIQTFTGGITEIETFRTTGSTSLGGRLPWGTQYDLSLNSSKEESTFNRFFEEYSGTLTLNISQPLLRGAGLTPNLARVRVAKKQRQVAENQVHTTVMNTVADVVKAYWQLAGAIESVRVREQSVENAERLLEINKKRLAIKTAAPIEVTQAEAGVATRLGDLISARAQVRDAEDVLKQLLDMREDDYFERAPIEPVDELELTEIVVDEQLSIDYALAKRPEIHSAELQAKIAELDRKRAKNDLLPQFDLQGSVSQGGRDHKLRQVFYGIRDRRDNSYTVGFQGSIPLGNRAARGAYKRAEISERQAEQDIEQTKQQLILNVRRALRDVRTNRALIESSRVARELQERNVEAEERRLQLGVTTSYRVLEVQEDLTNAQTQEVQALISYEQSKVDLALAEGRVLDMMGIKFEAPQPEQTVSFFDSIWPGAPPE